MSQIVLNLDSNAALVLLELLGAREEEMATALGLHAPERNAIWHLEAALERTLAEVFSPDYAQHLERARQALVQHGGAE